MLTTHAVGIDLGTTYSCIAYLNEHGEPVTLPNREGELSTPSVVMFDDNEVVVGTEALRNSILHPDRVIQNAKRYIGDANHKWFVGGKPYTPTDISTFVLKKLISEAQEQIGPIEQAVITVPAQFSDAQRHATMEAGHRAGLSKVDIINEPVAAALCYVLGTEGLWFTELADEQKIMVYDLGGGTFDLSLVRYAKKEVSVIASSGDLHLGGIDWNNSLLQAIANQFTKEFGVDPRTDPASLQSMMIEAETAKRALSVRSKAVMTVQHGGHRKAYQVELAQFEKVSKSLVDRTTELTQQMLKDNKLGWAHVDVVLTTGGASRMPQVREAMKKLSGRTLNTSLSPDLSIAHGATYYAGMLLTDNKFAKSILNEKAHERLSQVKQRSVNARSLGILVRDMETNTKVPHYLIPANTPLPTETTQNFGTVSDNQKRVNLQIAESGTSPDKPPAILGNCVIDDLPPNLPEGSEIAVTIRYDEQARVQVFAKDVTSGKQATAEILRSESLVPQLASDHNRSDNEVSMLPAAARKPGAPSPAPMPPANEAKPSPEVVPAASPPPGATKAVAPPSVVRKAPAASEPAPSPSVRPAPKPRPVPSASGVNLTKNMDDADKPVPLCNQCGEPLDPRGVCTKCASVVRKPAAGPRPAPAPASVKGPAGVAKPAPGSIKGPAGNPTGIPQPGPRPVPQPRPVPASRPGAVPLPSEDEIVELDKSAGPRSAVIKSGPPAAGPRTVPSPRTAPAPKAVAAPSPRPTPPAPGKPAPGKPAPPNAKPTGKKDDISQGEDEFWQIDDE